MQGNRVSPATLCSSNARYSMPKFAGSPLGGAASVDDAHCAILCIYM